MFYFIVLWYINVLEKYFQRSRYFYSRQELGDLIVIDRVEDWFLSECLRDCIFIFLLFFIIVISFEKKFFFDLLDIYFYLFVIWFCVFFCVWNQLYMFLWLSFCDFLQVIIIFFFVVYFCFYNLVWFQFYDMKFKNVLCC